MRRWIGLLELSALRQSALTWRSIRIPGWTMDGSIMARILITSSGLVDGLHCFPGLDGLGYGLVGLPHSVTMGYDD